jgi:hypothetical protein
VRDEAGGCTHLEDEFCEAVLGSEQNPGAVGEFFEDQWAAASRQWVGSWDDGDELFPSETNDGTSPLGRAWANGDVAYAGSYSIIECPPVLVFA